MSESLSKLAAKIDFGKGQDEKEEKLNEKTEDDAATRDPAAYQSSLWPWDSVRNKLKYVSYQVFNIDILYCVENPYILCILCVSFQKCLDRSLCPVRCPSNCKRKKIPCTRPCATGPSRNQGYGNCLC